MTRRLVTLCLAVAASAAFGRGNLRSALDFLPRADKAEARGKSVLEKGYAPPAEDVPKGKPAGSDDADTLLDMLAAEVQAERTATKPVAKPVTNAFEKAAEKPVVAERPVTNVVERVVEKPVEVERVVTVERPVTNTVEVVRVETVEVEKPVTNVVERVVVQPVTNVVERVVEKPVTNVVEVEKVVTVEKPVEVVVERHVTNVVEKIVEVEKPVIVERTNVVEKVIYDHGTEMRLAKDKAELERRSGMLEARNAGLEKRNDELKRELAEERGRRERLERTASGAGAKAKKTGRPAHITAATTYYDRKKGVAMFEGKVHVDDESYQLHADKAYVFTAGTNDVRRIVAVGHVAMTNDTRRAYGGKVSYYRQDGMVVLYAGDGINAEIRDESKAEDQTVVGSRIKFWIDGEQVEVLDAAISAPTDGAGLQGLGK